MNVICACGFSVPKGTKCDCRLKRDKARQTANDTARGSAASRGYGADWQELRARFIASHKECCVCGETATHVDHIQSVRDRPDLRLAESNLRAMCASCHSRRTARDQSPTWGRPSRVRAS